MKIAKKKKSKWSKEKIINLISKEHKADPDNFSSALLGKKYKGLNNAIYRLFDNFEDAVNTAGIDYEVRKFTKWDFDKVNKYIRENSESTLVSNSYVKMDQKLKFICACKEDFETSFEYFLYNNKRQCDKCGLRKSHEEFTQEVKEKFNDKIKVLDRYIDSNTLISFSCEEHGAFLNSPHSVLTSLFGCSRCAINSMSEKKSKGYRVCCECGSDKYVKEFKDSGKNYCGRHYDQLRLYGKILKKTIFDRNEILYKKDHAEIVIRNQENEDIARCLVSLDKIEKVRGYKWYLTSNGYVASRSNNNKKDDLIHRVIMNPNRDQIVDHINHNPLDNRNNNLRIGSWSQNSMNSRLKSNNTSGVTGVSWCKKQNKWVAEIFLDGKKYLLGSFNDLNEATKIRREAELKYFGEFATKKQNLMVNKHE